MARDTDSTDSMIVQTDGVPETVTGFLDRLEAVFAWELIVPKVIQIVVIVALALLAFRAVKLLTRRLEREVEEEDVVVKRLREQRARTLGGLLNNVALIVIAAVTLLTVVTTLGIDIGPALATAGVAGLAISFGAQSLVKDIITGAFILVEGQFGIGDVVRIGDVSGMVEKITLRTTILRDVQGVVHIIPNGTIDRVSNLTKTWSRAVLDIGVAYREDVDRVMEVMRGIGREVFEDPAWRELLVEEPEVPGVENLADSAVIIRMIAKTIPLKQWDVARELRRRIKKRFDAEGIEIPFPHLTFYWGEDQVPSTLASLPAAER